MKDDEARQEVIKYWMEKAHESLQSARSEQQAGRFIFAINRGYYGCFYSASAVLLREGAKFTKHSGVRAAVHRSLINTGKIDSSWGRFYDLIFNSRQRGDYQELVVFSMLINIVAFTLDRTFNPHLPFSRHHMAHHRFSLLHVPHLGR